MRIGPEIARRLFLSGNLLLRLVLLGFIALFLSQIVVAAARAQEPDRTRTAIAGPRGEPVRAVRIWPAQDYTRVTLESKAAITHSLLAVKNPDRLVLDLEDVDYQTLAQEIAGKIGNDDPYISALRAGRYKPGVVRLVFDLKGEVKPQIFTLKPVGDYGHRLVLDIYPAKPADPLMALLDKGTAKEIKEAPAIVDPVRETPPPLPLRMDPEVHSAEPRPESRPPAPPAPSTERLPEPRVEKAVPKLPEVIKPAVQRLITVAIDAGHGGEDPGARGRRGTQEKNVTLMIARRLKALIDAEPGMRGVLTREGDYFVPLVARVEKARRVKADLFVSIHADAFIKPHARGSSVFALSERGATSAAARWLAKRENEADLIGGVNLDVKDKHLAQTLLDLSQTATIQDSLKLARSVLGEIGTINTLHKDHVEQAGFAVLKAPDIPSILVETAFISNPEEEARLSDESYQDKLAQAVLRGIRRHFTRNPSQTRPVVAGNTPSAVSIKPVLAANP